MSENYDEVWKCIQRSPFWGMYLTELYWLAKRIADELDRVFAETPAPAEKGMDYLRVDHALHDRVLNALNAAARLRSLIRDRETQTLRGQREILRRRTRTLHGLLQGIDLSSALDAAARNSVEHFDEYMDDTAIKSYRGVIHRPTLLPLDFIASRRNVFEQLQVGDQKPVIHAMRTYIVDERVFCNCGKELDLGGLHRTCRAIQARIEPLVPSQDLEDRGSYVLVVTDKSFDQRPSSG